MTHNKDWYQTHYNDTILPNRTCWYDLDLMEGACYPELLSAARKGHVEDMEKLIDLGANVNITNECGLLH